MILIDTSIIVSFWRTNDTGMKSIIDKNDICICGTVRAELYAGAKNDFDLQRIKIAISGFHECDAVASTWDLLGVNLYTLRKNGISVPFQDVLISTIGMQNNIPVWTSDNHFSRIAECITGVSLFKPDAGIR
jgi:predicted nucleic acid-binding protein